MPENSSHDSSPGAITQCLQDWQRGDVDALSRLTTAVYSELRRVAVAILGRRQGMGTVQPTVLVHELYLQLPGIQQMDWQGRAQFLNVAARMMRNILVDYARMQHAAKRGGGATTVVLENIHFNDPGLQVDVLEIHRLLEVFSAEFPRQARVVELRFFGGLTEEETSEVLQVTGEKSSARTVARDWAFAKAWLQKSLEAS